MNPSYARIRLPIDETLRRFSQWLGLKELTSPEMVKWNEVVSKATKNGVWRSLVAVFVYEARPWTVLDDLTGHLASFSAEQWREFAGNDELLFAGYNDSVPYGQLIVVQSGRVIRNFLDDQQDPQHNVNSGLLASEQNDPIKDWIGAASFVDNDEPTMNPDEGLLWMLGPTNSID